MWEIYDDLIAAVPPDLTVEECLVGLHWTLVRSRTVGLAMTPQEGTGTLSLAGRMAGMTVRRLAELIKSWNFFDATVGLAAINSVLNTPERLESLSGRHLAIQTQTNAFAHFAGLVRGKRVAVIGHFPDLEALATSCRLSILERRPQPGDYPDPACEYLLPQQDCVFITATTLVNKTLPRLLELCRHSFTVLVGPSTPLTPILFRYGIDALAGSVVTDPASLRQVAQEGGTREIFRRGALMVQIGRDEVQEVRENGTAPVTGCK